MLDGRGHARITDFGLAVTDDTRTEGEIAGTPGYMAPEQVAGGVVSSRTDLYALGLMLAELLSGKRVIRVSTVQDRRRQDQDVEALARVALGTTADSRLVDMIVRCLKADPTLRPASAREVANALPGGGDPLAAALAAGETPSPEMVAAADGGSALHPRTALACLAFALTGLVVAAWQMDRMMLYKQVPLLKSPHALAERAQQVITRVGYTEAPRDSAYWFVAPGAYGDFARRRSGLYEPIFRPSTSREATGLVFVYRQSPAYFIPENVLGVVEYREPPADVPGMADVTMDPAGRLVRFIAVPERHRQPLNASPDWLALFSEAGLDHRLFSPIETTWVPPVTADAVVAWQGRRAGSAGEQVQVLAASFSGKPVAFETAQLAPSAAPPDSAPRGGFAYMALTLIVLFGSGMLARWNIRQGRWDRLGARRLVAFVFAVNMMGVLRADHVPFVEAEYLIIVRIAGWGLYLCGFTFLIYAAFEPLVRRRWPHMLTSWTRVLTGRLRDPLVGRDTLMGAAAGAAVALLREAEFVICRLLGLPSPPALISTLEGLGSWQQFASLLLFVHVEALTLALSWLTVLLFARIVLRRDSVAAIAATILVLPLTTVPGPYPLLETLLGALIAALSVFVLFRFGLLALVVQIFVAIVLIRLPITLDASEWYVGRSLFVLLYLSAVMIFGFYTSLGRRPLFARRLVED
jgi:serine/threonine-protein kinase